MKLLLVTHYMPPHHGGIERVAEDHAIAAAEAGFAVEWVASRDPRDAPAEERLAWGRALRVSCWNGIERRLGVPYPVWSPAAARLLRACVDAADLVHVHDVLYPGTSIALGRAARAAKPALLTQHVGFVPYPSRLLAAAERLAYATVGRRNAARATAVAHYSDAALAWLRRACGYRGPAHHLPNPVDAARFRPAADEAEKRELRRRHALPLDRPVVLFVGRLVHKKGAQVLLDAADADAYHLLLIGERGQIDLPERPGVELRPFVERDVLAEILRAADVLALPSRGEGFPLVAQEAMASGLAVLLGDEPAYAREVDPGALVLVEPTVAELRAALGRLASSPAERAGLGRRARASALRHWGTEACRARLIELYRTLGARSSPAPDGILVNRRSSAGESGSGKSGRASAGPT